MMTRQLNHRLATTAIAAVLAFSSTPLLAQDTQPVTEPVAETPVTATPDPLAPAPVPAEAPSATEATTDATPESVMIAAEPAPAATATPVARRATTSGRSVNRVARTSAPAASPAAAPVAAPAEAPMATPVESTLPEPVAADPFAEPPVAAPEPADTTISDDVLPIAGAAGLGILALAGAGMALRRRKRRREEEAEWEVTEAEAEPVYAQEPAPVVRPAPVMQPEPVFARQPAPMHDRVPTDAPVTALPAGFDISRFGRHVQAAYRGPTPDNPSLSLKNRLRRAAFFDQQERRTGATAPEPVTAEAHVSGWTVRKDDEFMFRRAGSRSLRPAFQQ